MWEGGRLVSREECEEHEEGGQFVACSLCVGRKTVSRTEAEAFASAREKEQASAKEQAAAARAPKHSFTYYQLDDECG